LALPTLPLPKVSIFKGFGGGVDLGFSFISSGEAFSIYGGSIQWAFLRKSPVGPHAALRLSAAFSDLSFISTSNYGLDLIVSKKLAIIDPYLGAGFQLWSGSLEVPNFPGGLTNSNSGFSPHIFVGLPINLLFLKLVGEYDYNFAGVTTYGGKIALSF
jgi:hypothetical protein